MCDLQKNKYALRVTQLGSDDIDHIGCGQQVPNTRPPSFLYAEEETRLIMARRQCSKSIRKRKRKFRFFFFHHQLILEGFLGLKPR
jgi:hypothetical protein